MDTRDKIKKIVREVVALAPRAANISREWSACMEVVELSTRLELTVQQMRLSEGELQVYLEQVRCHRQFLKDTISGKRKRHPERSKRTFL